MNITRIVPRYQPTGNSCGPTCLYMVAEFISRKHHDLPWDHEFKYNIEQICDMCGTDWIVGTPPDRMEKGMRELNLNYVEYIDSTRPYELLNQVIASKNIAIVRTITNGIPHWIIVNEYYEDENTYGVLCPSRGPITYTVAQLDKVWSLRQYQFFEIITDEN